MNVRSEKMVIKLFTYKYPGRHNCRSVLILYIPVNLCIISDTIYDLLVFLYVFSKMKADERQVQH